MIRHIISYHDNPDIRRWFGIYGRIDKEKFSILKTITRTANPDFHHAHQGYLYQQYILPNLYDLTGRGSNKLKHDYLEMKICDYNNKVYYNFGIYRLKPDTIKNYYWQCLQYSFILEH